MPRGHFKQIATRLSLAAMLAQPLLACGPAMADQPSLAVVANQGQVRLSAAPTAGSKSVTAAGTHQPVGAVQHAIHQGGTPLSGEGIRQVSGARSAGQSRTPASTSQASSQQATGSQSARSSNQPSRSTSGGPGFLGGLFGGKEKAKPSTTKAPPVATKAPVVVNWDGIPYHEARSRVAKDTSGATPLRDPKPGEAQITSPKSLQDTQPNEKIARSNPPSSSANSSSRQSLPTPPSLEAVSRKPIDRPAEQATEAIAVSSRRRNSMTESVPVKVERHQVEVLSPLSSSRRSGRRSVPKLDLSDMVASKSASQRPAAASPKVERKQVAAVTSKSTQPTATTTPAKAVVAKPTAEVPTQSPAAMDVASGAMPSENQSSSRRQPVGTAQSQLGQPPAAQSTVAQMTPPRSTPAMGGLSPNPPAGPVGTSSQPAIPVAPVSNAPRSAELATTQPAPSAPNTFRTASAPIGSGLSGRPAAIPVSQHQALPNPTRTAQSTTPPLPASGAQPAPSSFPTSPLRSTANAARPPAQTVAAGSTSSDLHRATSRPSQASGTPLRASAAPVNRQVSNQMRSGRNSVSSELPGLRVVTVGPSSVLIHEAQPFEIRVENRGSIDASGIMVRALVPDWAKIKDHRSTIGTVEKQQVDGQERMVWILPSLPAGTSQSLNLQLQAFAGGVHGLDIDWTLVPQQSVTSIEVKQPELQLVIDGPEEVVYGQSQTYRVRVMNPGNGIASDVMFTLSPESSSAQSQPIGDIPSGKEAQFEIELTAQDMGDLKISGLASSPLGLKSNAEKNIRVTAARLESALAGPELRYQDSSGAYLLELTNQGNAVSQNVQATLKLPAGVRYSGGIQGAQQQGNTLFWTVDGLAPGASHEYEFQCLMASPGNHNIEFSAEGSAAGKTYVALTTRVESIADLVMTIQDPAAPAPIGSEVAYEIVVNNRGSRQADAVRVIAQFSEGIEPIRIEGHTGRVLTGQVLLDPIKAIQPGQTLRIKVIAKAETEGNHRFRTEIRSGETVLVAEEATRYLGSGQQRVSRRSSNSPR
ncbi:Large cysteine-rich periplasmic protein OmcB [Stieleria bergensis]|uniref:Large cysteine-rich periplasmic protein OmcB n=1 Tax=Stieleria bergensis TaxID=2528025 RepID=A0A517SQ97_9BACT|nr:Large cysteine-rich periplasmic protein OmcB [Planctomycetes bacterium SV_7m_r]